MTGPKDSSSSYQPASGRPISDASSIAIPISSQYSSSDIVDLYNDPNDPGPRGSFLPYLSAGAAPAPDSRGSRNVSSSTLKDNNDASAPAAKTSPRPLESPRLAHLGSSPQPAGIKSSGQSSPVINRGDIRTSPYNSPDIAISVPGTTSFTQEGEKQRLVNENRSSKRYSKVLQGLGLFGATQRRKPREDLRASKNSKDLQIQIAAPMAGTKPASAPADRNELLPTRSASDSFTAPAPSEYKPPSAHFLGSFGVHHAQGMSSASSFHSHEGKYPATQTDAFSTGLVPILNLEDGNSSTYLLSSPRRPYAPGSFTNGSRSTRSPGASYFEEKRLGSGSSVSSPLIRDISTATDEVKMWGDFNEPEADDYLHDPDADEQKKGSKFKGAFAPRALLNIGTLMIMMFALLALFAGYPITSSLNRPKEVKKGSVNIGGVNATGQVADLHVGRALIDPDTPQSAMTRTTLDGTNRKMNLVFSDEFNQPGRSFYPGDDPFWTAVDLHYWGTDNFEWYDPSAVTTKDGSLVITLSQTPTHNLNFRGGMLQSWNQFCFTGGYIEVSMVLPGGPDVPGLWPAAWTMGNLGRAGYGATTDGMWPYTYDSCDVGTLPNQTFANGTGPIAAQTTGVYVEKYGPYLSYLPGQRLSRCTCANSMDHPGPKHADGTWVGRSAPEIDIIEAGVGGGRGFASMSAQIAPFNTGYNLTSVAGTQFYSPDAQLNAYTGSVYQQAASGLVYTHAPSYQATQGTFDQYGFEYNPGGTADSYILWTRSGERVWRLNAAALGPDAGTQIGQRPIPYEPMYILLNLGISASFTTVDWAGLADRWPAVMLVDYVRVWQVEGEENIGCDPETAPTADYINKHAEAYWNNNLTTWTGSRATGGYNQRFPGNTMIPGQC